MSSIVLTCVSARLYSAECGTPCRYQGRCPRASMQARRSPLYSAASRTVRSALSSRSPSAGRSGGGECDIAAFAAAKIHGSPNAPRPIMHRSAPV